MHIGLVGGIGPAATDVYYRGLIKHAARVGRDLELTIVHADTPTLLGHLADDNSEAQCAIYNRLTKRLSDAGAECVVVTSIAGHFCIDAFAEISPLKVIGLPEAVRVALQADGRKTVGILGTQRVMQSQMYGKLAPVDVLAPAKDSISQVHEAYVALATSGQSTPELQRFFFCEGQKLIDRGAEAVLLGGTDLNPAFQGADCGFEIVDCAGIHIEAVAKHI